MPTRFGLVGLRRRTPGGDAEPDPLPVEQPAGPSFHSVAAHRRSPTAPGRNDLPGDKLARPRHHEAIIRRRQEIPRRRCPVVGSSLNGDEPLVTTSRRPLVASARSRRVRRWPRRVLVIANLTVFAVLAGATTVVGYASYEIGSISRVVAPGLSRIVPDPNVRGSSRTSPPFTMLIVGSDTRSLKGPIGVAVGNTTTNPEDLSDSIILVRVDPGQHRLALLSIPRDLYVAVPGLGTTKINSAFAGNDPGRLITVIRDDLGIPVNHFAEVNFYTFEQIADAIGGVEQYFPTPAFDVESGLQIPKAGCIDLKGEQALGFVRSRNYFYVLDGDASLQLSPESDLGRIQRQQAFVKNAIAKVGRSHALTDPLTLTRLVSAVTKNLTLDNTFSDRKIIDLARVTGSWAYPAPMPPPWPSSRTSGRHRRPRRRPPPQVEPPRPPARRCRPSPARPRRPCRGTATPTRRGSRSSRRPRPTSTASTSHPDGSRARS
jgi:LCP family protein required for cell wall assembly